MAKPLYYPDWATQDVNLPATGNVNKVRPREVIRNVGWDFGQIPTAEEFNFWFNNVGAWVRYFDQEFIPTLPNTYLPKNGTKITLTGDLTGTITFIGSSIVSASVQVVDNSHKHLSADITDASYSPTPNVLVKRGNDGTITAGRNMIGYAPAGNNFDFRVYDDVTDKQVASMAWARDGSILTLYTGDTAKNTASVFIHDDGYVRITSPRSLTAQELRAEALVRYDYLNTRLTGLQNTMQGQIDRIDNGFVQDVRLGPQYTKIVNKDTPTAANSGGVMVGWYYEGDNPGGDTIYFRPVQKYYNGSWVTVSQA